MEIMVLQSTFFGNSYFLWVLNDRTDNDLFLNNYIEETPLIIKQLDEKFNIKIRDGIVFFNDKNEAVKAKKYLEKNIESLVVMNKLLNY